MNRLLLLSSCHSLALFFCLLPTSVGLAREPDATLDIWPAMAPGETTANTGEALPRKTNENPPATRIQGITRPRLLRFDPPEGQRNGTAMLIFPGGAFNYVVSDKEGAEAAAWLNGLGITAFVVHYRTKDAANPAKELWRRPVADGQRAISLVRSRAKEWGLNPDAIGVIGFSAGGQAAAILTTRGAERFYARIDAVDDVSCRPDFSLLIYPWNLVDGKTGQTHPEVRVDQHAPPVFLVHAHDDGSTSLGSIAFYVACRQRGLPAELHIYETGGHGYGMRPVNDSNVATWPDRAGEWLARRKLGAPPD